MRYSSKESRNKTLPVALGSRIEEAIPALPVDSRARVSGRCRVMQGPRDWPVDQYLFGQLGRPGVRRREALPEFAWERGRVRSMAS